MRISIIIDKCELEDDNLTTTAFATATAGIGRTVP